MIFLIKKWITPKQNPAPERSSIRGKKLFSFEAGDGETPTYVPM